MQRTCSFRFGYRLLKNARTPIFRIRRPVQDQYFVCSGHDEVTSSRGSRLQFRRIALVDSAVALRLATRGAIIAETYEAGGRVKALWKAARRMLSLQAASRPPTSSVSHLPATSGLSDDDLIACIPSLPRQHLPAIARRLLRAGILDAQTWSKMSARVIEVAWDLGISECVAILHAFATRKYRDFNVFAHLSARILSVVEESGRGSLSARDSVTLLVASATLQFSDSRLMRILTDRSMEVVDELSPKALAITAHAYTKLRSTDPVVFASIAEALLPRLSELTPLSLSKVCTSYASTAVYNKDLFDGLVTETVKRVEDFSTLESLGLLRGLSRLYSDLPSGDRRNDAECIRLILWSLHNNMGSMTVLQLLQVFENIAALGYFDSKFIYRRLVVSLATKLAGLKPVTAMDDENASRSSAALQVHIRCMRCLSRLPAVSSGAVQLLQQIVDSLPPYLRRGNLRHAVQCIDILHELQCWDYECFSIVEALIMRNRRAALRQLNYYDACVLQRAYEAFPLDSAESKWSDISEFLGRVIGAVDQLAKVQGSEVGHSEENRESAVDSEVSSKAYFN